MTNDTTTLNGALTELGELMADNLNSMGVSDADASDGLTTLANKILDIAPVSQNLTLTSNKSVLSAYDSEYATLTATLSGGVVEGQTVSFDIVDSGTVVENIGTAQTNSSGVATVSYYAEGTGDLNIQASVGMIVSEIYAIEDCIKVGFNNWTGTFTTGTDTYDYITPSTVISPNVSLPNAFQVTFKFKNMNNSQASTGSGLWNIGVDTNNGILIGHEGTDKRIRAYIRTNGNNSAQTPQNNAYSYQTWTDAEITYQNGTISLSVGGKTISYNISAPNIMQTYEPYTKLRIAEWKIKPL